MASVHIKVLKESLTEEQLKNLKDIYKNVMEIGVEEIKKDSIPEKILRCNKDFNITLTIRRTTKKEKEYFV